MPLECAENVTYSYDSATTSERTVTTEPQNSTIFQTNETDSTTVEDSVIHDNDKATMSSLMIGIIFLCLIVFVASILSVTTVVLLLIICLKKVQFRTPHKNIWFSKRPNKKTQGNVDRTDDISSMTYNLTYFTAPYHQTSDETQPIYTVVNPAYNVVPTCNMENEGVDMHTVRKSNIVNSCAYAYVDVRRVLAFTDSGNEEFRKCSSRSD